MDMEWKYFILKIVDTLSWPIVAVIGAYLAYKILKEKVPNIDHIEWKDFKFSTGRNTTPKVPSKEDTDNYDEIYPHRKYIKIIEKTALQSKFYALQDGINIVSDSLTKVASLFGIKVDNIEKTLPLLKDKGIISDVEIEQVIHINNLFKKLTSVDLKKMKDTDFEHFVYGCAATASLLDDIFLNNSRKK